MIIKEYLAIFRYISQNRTVKMTLYVLLVVMLSLAVETVIWASARLENLKLQRQVDERRTLVYKQEQLTKLSSHIDKARPLIESLESKYKSTSSQSDVMKQIGELARLSNLHVTSQSYARADTQDSKSSVSTIEMRLSGRYVDLRKMLNKIPALSFWVEIADIRIERLGNSHSNVGAELKLIVLKEHLQ